MRYVTQLPLHGGRAPRWLFGRMVKLGGLISTVVIDEFGVDEYLERLCDPGWFQALSCAIGYDWHSSGTTTVTMGALREALGGSSEIFIAGGKGKAGINTPNDIRSGVDNLSISQEERPFVEFSRLAAKIDGTMVYDDIGIYHHSFIFTKNRKWGVVQQAMDYKSSNAIRFQWFSDRVNMKDVAGEPHSGIETDMRKVTIDLTDGRNHWARSASVEILEDINSIHVNSYPARHGIVPDIDVGKRGWEAIRKASELEPKDYRELLLTKGVGRSTLRSLALISSLVYDKELASRDPITYAYNLGGKDGIPFVINRGTYDNVVDELKHAVDAANMESGEKYKALKRLNAALAR
ncbi:MAG: DUF763 domain-containing protein [Candidatus Micrarchaeota archaeon]|nr:DUF763 domain-containing protein [Candidatus Micrarchaeota archaeon]